METDPNAWSLVPPLLAIVLAVATRRVYLALFLAVAAGVLILNNNWQNPWHAAAILAEDVLWAQLTSGDNLRVFAFTMLMGAMVGVMYRAGAMLALVEAITPWANNRRRGQAAGWGLGMLVFFDDYANTLVLGNTMRPVTDRLLISREKLAYIVDSTAAPVAGLALVSTWVAIEIKFIQQGFDGLNMAAQSNVGFQVFWESIPYRFYPLLALLFVPLVALMGRDFGPMLKAERRARHKEPKETDATTTERSSQPSRVSAQSHALAPDPAAPRHWFDGIFPVVCVVAAVLLLLVVTGQKKLDDEARKAEEKAATSRGFSFVEIAAWTSAAAEPGQATKRAETASLLDALMAGDSYIALLYGALLGLAVAAAAALLRRSLGFRQARAAAAAGALYVVPALAILWLASAVRAVCNPPADGGLGTGEYLGELLGRELPLFLLPTVVFLLSSFVAFATGTSWGTMGILTPLVVSVTFRMLSGEDAAPAPTHPIMLATVGAVLAGAIFGDHCSPISDTTILSSLASGCDHIAHVWTQMPYALFVAAVAVVFGTLPAGFGIPMWGCLLLLAGGTAVLAAGLKLFGREVEGIEA